MLIKDDHCDYLSILSIYIYSRKFNSDFFTSYQYLEHSQLYQIILTYIGIVSRSQQNYTNVGLVL